MGFKFLEEKAKERQKEFYNHVPLYFCEIELIKK